MTELNEAVKIIFFDIDGTLIDQQAETMTDKTIEALKQLHANGYKLCVASGRPTFALNELYDLPFDAFLTFNGSYCFTRDDVVYENAISNEDIQQLAKNGEAIDRPIAIATNEAMHANGWDEDLAEYFSFGGMALEKADDFDDVSKHDAIYQVMSGGREEEYDALLKDIKGAEITAWWDRAVDIIPKGGGKGKAVEKFLDYYQLDASQAMAFGDGNNDLPMFDAITHGIAMGNGSDDLKAVAEDVCPSVADDGIYYYCQEKGLI